MNHGFSVTAYGWRVGVLADSGQMSAILNRYLLPWLPRTGFTEDVDAIFRIGPKRDGAGFELHAPDGVISFAATPEDIVPLLQNYLDAGVVRNLTRSVAVHAGTVAFGSAAIVLPGPSHSGKSTLVHELVRHGFLYFSDEYALIDQAGLVHPYPRALMLRNGEPIGRPVLVSETGASVGEGPVPVCLILALEYVPGAAWSVHPTTQSEMLIMLLKSTPQLLTADGRILEPMLRALSGAACYTGIRGQAADTVARILDLLPGRQ